MIGDSRGTTVGVARFFNHCNKYSLSLKACEFSWVGTEDFIAKRSTPKEMTFSYSGDNTAGHVFEGNESDKEELKEAFQKNWAASGKKATTLNFVKGGVNAINVKYVKRRIYGLNAAYIQLLYFRMKAQTCSILSGAGVRFNNHYIDNSVCGTFAEYGSDLEPTYNQSKYSMMNVKETSLAIMHWYVSCQPKVFEIIQNPSSYLKYFGVNSKLVSIYVTFNIDGVEEKVLIGAFSSHFNFIELHNNMDLKCSASSCDFNRESRVMGYNVDHRNNCTPNKILSKVIRSLKDLKVVAGCKCRDHCPKCRGATFILEGGEEIFCSKVNPSKKLKTDTRPPRKMKHVLQPNPVLYVSNGNQETTFLDKNGKDMAGTGCGPLLIVGVSLARFDAKPNFWLLYEVTLTVNLTLGVFPRLRIYILVQQNALA
jgi:hypothetical protein